MVRNPSEDEAGGRIDTAPPNEWTTCPICGTLYNPRINGPGAGIDCPDCGPEPDWDA